MPSGFESGEVICNHSEKWLWAAVGFIPSPFLAFFGFEDLRLARSPVGYEANVNIMFAVYFEVG